MNTLKSLKFIIQMNKFCLIILLVIIFCNGVIYAEPETPEPQVDLGYIQFNVKHIHIDSFFEVRVTEDGEIFLPMERAFEMLELYLFDINWQGNFITGMIPSLDTYYYFNFQNGEMQRGNEKYTISSDDYFVDNDQVYLHYKTFGEWLPLEITWDLYDFEILITPKFKLMSEILEERQEVRDKLLSRLDTEEKEIIRTPGYLLASGVINYNFSIFMDHKCTFRPGMAVSYIGSMLYGAFFGSMDFYPGKGLRLKTIQLDYRNILGIQQLVLGNTYVNFSPSLKKPAVVYGVMFHNKDRKYSFGVNSISGYVTPGSEVELYYRGMLVGFQKVDGNFYEFSDVPIRDSYNVYEIKVYSPEGMIITEKRYVLSREQLLKPGTFSYEGGVGFGADGFMMGGNVFYGLSENITIGSTVSVYENREDSLERYLGGKAIWKISPNTLFLIDTNIGLNSPGTGLMLELITAPAGWNWKTGLRTYSGIKPPLRDGIWVNGDFFYLDQELSTKLEKNLSRQNFGVDYSLANYGGHLTHQTSGRWSYQFNFNTLLHCRNTLKFLKDTPLINEFEGKLSYSGWELMDVQLDSRLAIKDWKRLNYSLKLNLLSKKSSNDRLNYSLGLGVYNQSINFVANGQYQITDWLTIGGSISLNSISLNLSIQETRRIWPFEILNSDNFGTGWLQGKVYLDTNGNSQWDEGESPFSKVRILVNDRPAAVTDEEGNYFLSGLLPYEELRIAVDVTSLDALYFPKQERVWVELHPGTGLDLNFAIVTCSGITGTIKASSEQMEELQYKWKIVLYDSAGEKISVCSPELDGFYMLDEIQPGQYQLRLELLEDADYQIKPEYYNIDIPFGDMSLWLDGFDFELIE